jgi:hypothetical protein
LFFFARVGLSSFFGSSPGADEIELALDNCVLLVLAQVAHRGHGDMHVMALFLFAFAGRLVKQA